MTNLYKGLAIVGVILGALALCVGIAAFSSITPAIDTGAADQQLTGGATNVGHVETISWGFPKGIVLGPNLLAEVNYDQIALAPGQNDVTWTNNGSRTAYVDLANLVTTGVASSTFKAYAYASTTSAIAPQHWNTALSFGGTGNSTSTQLFNLSLATSTAATSTNSIIQAATGRGLGVIAVPSGWRLHLTLQAVDSIACQVAKSCEMATSTNRGINTLQLTFRYFRI